MFYRIGRRWAFGFFTMNGTVNLPTVIIVSFYHLLVHCMLVSGISMIITYRIDPGEREIVVNGLPALNWVDGAGLHAKNHKTCLLDFCCSIHLKLTDY